MPAVLIRLSAVAIGALVLAGGAHAARVEVVVVPAATVGSKAAGGAIGLMPPGAGPTVTREGALAALVRGKVKSSLIGGVPHGKPVITLGTRKHADVSIFVSLPPPGSHPNNQRYPVVIIGGGYHGILKSPSTRIAGLVSIADIAPTAVALARGDAPRIRSTRGTKDDLRSLDRRLGRQLKARNGSVTILALSALALTLLAVAFSSLVLARAALLAAPLAAAWAITLAAAGVTRPAILLPLLAVLTIGTSLAGGVLLEPRGIATVFVGLVCAYLLVLVGRPTWAALAAIGPNPAGGTRFYGSGNLTTSILLTMALFAAGTFGLRSIVPIALLSLVTVGWSKSGADGGGVVVVTVSFAALWILLAKGKLTARTLALACCVAVGVGLALVGIDAATGGHSHVTHRVGAGPGAVLGDLGARLHLSAESIVTSWHAALVFTIAIAALVILATRSPRFAVGTALLVGIAVSLLVNDSPQTVAAAGAISYGALWAHERLRVDDARVRG